MGEREGDFMRSKYILFSVLFSTVVIFSFGGCNPNPPPNPPEDQPVWFIEMPGSIASGDGVSLHFGWRITGENLLTTAALRFCENGGTGCGVVARSPQISLSQGSGEGTIVWDGRKLMRYDGRRVPIPLGEHQVDINISGSYSSQRRSITAVANGFDSEGDDISDVVEDENYGTPIIDESANTHYAWYVPNNMNLPPTIPTTISSNNLLYPNRGTHDYSLARGSASNGSLYNGLRTANFGTGYYYFSARDPLDSDNYGVLMTVNNVERVGRRWRELYQTGARVGSGDISLGFGGYWPDHAGGTHQRGLDVDLRYMRTDSNEQNFSFGVHPQSDFDFQKTYDLIELFVQAGASRIIVDARTGFTATYVIVLESPGTGAHDTHFHVEFPDPDGNN